jgi:hypothetical protein
MSSSLSLCSGKGKAVRLPNSLTPYRCHLARYAQAAKIQCYIMCDLQSPKKTRLPGNFGVVQ